MSGRALTLDRRGAVLCYNSTGLRTDDSSRFWFSFIKILTLVGLLLLGLIIDLGGVPGQDRIGFAYWKHGLAFIPYKQPGSLGKFLGFVNALVLALYAYIGTELVGVTVGEAKVSRAIPLKC